MALGGRGFATAAQAAFKLKEGSREERLVVIVEYPGFLEAPVSDDCLTQPRRASDFPTDQMFFH